MLQESRFGSLIEFLRKRFGIWISPDPYFAEGAGGARLDVVVTKELRMIFAQWIRPLYRVQKYTWKINYTLGGGEIHGEKIELYM